MLRSVRHTTAGLCIWFTTIPLVAGTSSALAEKQLLWGDTHVHSAYSTDAFINQNFTAGPDTAYRYAKGLAVMHPNTGIRIQIETPLDFLVVSDHAESYGVMRLAVEQGLPRDNLGPIDWVHSWLKEKMFRLLAKNPDSVVDLLEFASADTTDVVEAAKTPASISIPGSNGIAADTWRSSTEVSDLHNEPGRFTALIGWEWSSIPAGSNLHRVVFTDSNSKIAQRYIPFSSSTNSYPEALWKWLDETSEKTGADFVAIPHNSNISRGYMFPNEFRLNGTPIDKQWVQARARWEVAVEATQIKGDSETDPAVSPDDRFADFESYPHYISPKPIPFDPGKGDFVRSALRTGLQLKQQFGKNPYRFGVIGSTDSHTSLASAEEANFWGKFLTDSTLQNKTKTTGGIENFGWAMSASGLAAVWSEDNTREAIMQAFKRREIYATTGPRIAVRFYAQTAKATETENSQHPSSSDAVSMGGEIVGQKQTITFHVHASKDPNSGSLDRIQIIKGWLQDDRTFEKIHDVAWAGNRVKDASGNIPPVANTVDAQTARYSNQYGASELRVSWEDPDFDPTQAAFYYARVLQVPTPRHSTMDAVALGIPADSTGHPISIQERAYTSAIHYSPSAD